MGHSEKFWNRIAEGYAKKPVADVAVYQQKLQLTREHLRPHMKVLEIGCGTGTTALAHAPYVNHILAIDFSENMISIARSKAANMGNVTFETGTADTLSLPDGSLDVVMAFSFLHLVENKEAVIEKAFNLLKPGGLFVSSTACIGDTMAFFKWIAPIGIALGLLPLLTVFKRGDLEDCLTDTGFTILNSWQPSRGKGVFIIAQK